MGKIADEETLRRNRNVTPQFIGALTETVLTQIGIGFHFFQDNLNHTHRVRRIRLTTPGLENVALDLENFSRHAGRTTITTDDVLLLARRNQDLHAIMKESVDRRKAAKAKAKAKSRR